MPPNDPNLKKNARLLCIDSSATVRSVLRLAFGNWQHVEVFGTPLEALVRAKAVAGTSDAFNAIVLGIEMSPFDGIELARQLREVPAYRTIPVVFLTTHAEDSKRVEECRRIGTDVISKSQRTTRDWVDAISRCLDHVKSSNP